MKMVYVASLSREPDRDSGWIREFASLGWEVITFSSDFSSDAQSGGTPMWSKIERRLHLGETNRAMQEHLVKLVEREAPEWVHFRLPVGIERGTVNAIRRASAVTCYFNDDPFSWRGPVGFHWRFRWAISAYDAHFVYRARNLPAYRAFGARCVEHCPPAYDPVRHRAGLRRADGGFIADAAFVGHWEGDWRAECLQALESAGLRVIIRGGGWDEEIKRTTLKHHMPIDHAFGSEYNFVYANSLAGLCFFSKINNDHWTERALEIVAVGGLLVCERTEEAKSHFAEDREALYFSSVEELVDIVTELRRDPQRRERICKAGFDRLQSGRERIADRAAQVDRVARQIVEARRAKEDVRK